MIGRSREQKIDMMNSIPRWRRLCKSGNVLELNQLPRDYSLEAIIKDALYVDNLIFSSDDAGTLIRDVVGCTLVLSSFSFKVHEAFSNLPLQLLEIENIVRRCGGHLKLHPSIAGIVI